ncbi:MAG: efflux RND transporter permease subunit [Phycisphaerae bacterium]|jgi:multidrug efflux pump subunit AcrB
MSDTPASPAPHHGFTNAVVRVFLHSNLSIILIVLGVIAGGAALWGTPREEDPQIVVPLADVYVSVPGRSAAEIEQLVATPLEKLLYQIDGVEYVYSMSREGQAIITVRFFVGEDRERSLVKLFKRIDENVDIVPPGVTGWVIKPVEIDDVPIVTLTLTAADAPRSRPPAATPSQPATDAQSNGRGPDEHALRRVAEEVVERLASVENLSRAYIVGGQPRVARVYLDPQRMSAYSVSPLEIQRALQATNVHQSVGSFTRDDRLIQVDAGRAFVRVEELRELVVGVFGGRPVLLKDVAEICDGPAEATSYVRHGWGPARGFEAPHGFTGTVIGEPPAAEAAGRAPGGADASKPAVTIALAKKKGSNAVWVARECLEAAAVLQRDVIPSDMQLVVTRNYGHTADEKVNELVEALGVAVVIVIALLTLTLGWREALVVAVAIPVVFGLTLLVNLLFGYTINRVTLFAMILSLGLLVDDPIVDVENIVRHFSLRRRATREVVLEAVAEIRPPLITATLAVIVSFLPMFFITGMMGPYMRPMALNVPVTMLMSMVVAFTITPWLAYHVLGLRHRKPGAESAAANHAAPHEEIDLETLRRTALWRLFYPLMAPLLRSRRAAWAFLAVMTVLTVGATSLAALRSVPLKMLPFDNKNELLLVLDFDEGQTLERTDAAVREFEHYVSRVPEVTDFTSYVGVASPMDFNGMVRHYYLRQGENVAELRINLAGKKHRSAQSHAVGLRLRDELTAIARRHGANLKLVETPPGPPVIASVVAEVYGQPDHSYEDLIAAAKTVKTRLEREPGVVDVDDSVEADSRKLVFVPDTEKAAINGVSVAEIAETLRIGLAGAAAGTVRAASERNPLRIELRLPRESRSSAFDLSQLQVKGSGGRLVPLAELGRWDEQIADKTIYHKNLQRVAYVFAETAGRPPAECVLDVSGDQVSATTIEDVDSGKRTAALLGAPASRTASRIPIHEGPGGGAVAPTAPRPVRGRTYVSNSGGIEWTVPEGIRVDFAGEGEWKITLDVFRDLGLAFGAAMIGIYVLLVAQTGSFVIPIVVMLAIPLTILGVMPGFWLLNAVVGGQVGGYADPVFFTATGMIGMIALAGIVTRDSIILVDFIHLSLARGRSLFDAILESRVVRLRPILLTAGAAMLGAAPITIDPIFSGLAWALIFGLFASTVFTLFVIPIAYWLLYARAQGSV